MDRYRHESVDQKKKDFRQERRSANNFSGSTYVSSIEFLRTILLKVRNRRSAFVGHFKYETAQTKRIILRKRVSTTHKQPDRQYLPVYRWNYQIDQSFTAER